MERIKHWKARRAGGRITLTGQNWKGEQVKIVGVVDIQALEDGIIATDKNSVKYVLGTPA